MIIVRIWEGLGNQMFQYAFAKALQEKGYCVRLDMDKAYNSPWFENKREDARDNRLQCFNITIPSVAVEENKHYSFLRRSSIWEKGICFLAQNKMWPYGYYREKGAGYKDELENIKGTWYLQGTFQSIRYFQDIREKLLREFTPKKKIKISNKLKEILKNDNTVSIHIRRGDYVKINHALSVYYYRQAIARIKEYVKNPFFVVFSNDTNWVKENLDLGMSSIYISDEKGLQDFEELLIMSKCKSNIISNSTFSWWGAWLNQNPQKCVIAPKIWYDGQEELVLEDWIVV